jgi:hypothetical protein
MDWPIGSLVQEPPVFALQRTAAGQWLVRVQYWDGCVLPGYVAAIISDVAGAAAGKGFAELKYSNTGAPAGDDAGLGMMLGRR